MAKTPDPKAREAGSNAGNPVPGADDAGMNARRRDAQAGGESVPDPLHAADLDHTSDAPTGGSGRAGLSVEQEDMERKREEYGSQERGSGDKPPMVHGRTHTVENAHSSIPRSTPLRTTDDGIVRDPTTIPRTRKVRALKLGYYDDKRRRTGDVFLIREPYQGEVENTLGEVEQTEIDEFSDKWMEDVDANTPERITTGRQALKEQHDAELAARRHSGQRSGPTGNADVIGDE